MPIIKSLNGKSPKIGKNVYIADNAVIVGDVEIGDYSSVWFNVVIRGDVNKIVIGHHTNIQDGTIIHCTYKKTETHIGNYVSIGHGVILHGCTIQDYVLVGMGAVVIDRAVIEEKSMVGAKSLVLEGVVLPANHLHAGIPCKTIKPLTEKHEQMIMHSANNYPMYAEWFAEAEDIDLI